VEPVFFAEPRPFPEEIEMSRSSFAPVAVAAVLASAAIVSTTPARADRAGDIVAGGVVGVVIGAGLASWHGDDDRFAATAPTYWYGSPGYQRPRRIHAGSVVPLAGPGRHVVCDWQDRYDRLERYAGSRRICWVEAR